MTYTQAGKNIGIETLLGTDVLLLLGISAKESISESFCYTLDLASDRMDITAKEILGKRIDFWLTLSDGTKRYFNGHVSRFSGGPLKSQGFRSYRMQVVSWSWFMGQNRNFRIFQNKSVLDIIEEIFNDYANANFQINCQKTYPPLDYCVQYQESSGEFVSRLMRENGLFYFFIHEQGKHTLILADNTMAYAECDEPNVIQTFSGEIAECIDNWVNDFEFFSGKFSQSDYDFESPSCHLLTTSRTVLDQPHVEEYEKYDYPGGFKNTTDARTATDIRMMEEEAGNSAVQASSNYRRFFVGCKFKLAEHAFEHEKDNSYVISTLSYSITENSYFNSTGESNIYSNSFTAQAADTLCFSENVPAKPKVYGPQTAVVVGPVSESVYTDKYGRVKVQFHWDRTGASDESSSCWVRVSQNWAGKNWGSVALPHVGNEVIVSFLNGDPDKPIITGRVYNAEQMPPQDLPENKHKNIIQDDFGNEIVLDATPGEEHIRIYSPSHESQIVLGESVKSQSTSDDTRFAAGNKAEASIGNSATFVGGTKVSAFLGAQGAVNAGLSAGFDMGFKYNLAVTGSYSHTFGTVDSWSWGPRNTHSIANVKTTAAGDHIVAAGKELCLAANTSSATGMGIPILTANDKIIGMSVSHAAPPITTGSKLWYSEVDATTNKIDKGLEIAAISTVVLASIAGFVGATILPQNSSKERDWHIAMNITALVLAAVGTSLASSRLLFQKADSKAIAPISHTKPDMKLNLNKLNGIEIESSTTRHPISLSCGEAAAKQSIKIGGPPTARLSLKDAQASEIKLGSKGINLEAKTAGVEIKSTSDLKLESKAKIEFSAPEVAINAPGVGFKANYNLIVLP